jgi:hypothetical protein
MSRLEGRVTAARSGGRLHVCWEQCQPRRRRRQQSRGSRSSSSSHDSILAMNEMNDLQFSIRCSVPDAMFSSRCDVQFQMRFNSRCDPRLPMRSSIPDAILDSRCDLQFQVRSLARDVILNSKLSTHLQCSVHVVFKCCEVPVVVVMWRWGVANSWGMVCRYIATLGVLLINSGRR